MSSASWQSGARRSATPGTFATAASSEPRTVFSDTGLAKNTHSTTGTPRMACATPEYLLCSLSYKAKASARGNPQVGLLHLVCDHVSTAQWGGSGSRRLPSAVKKWETT